MLKEKGTKPFLNIKSEIGKLKAVLLHRPGKELERITPDYLEELLFEDIPWLKKMQQEHDNFAKLLAGRDIKVLYVEDLLSEILDITEARVELINTIFSQKNKCSNYIKPHLKEYLLSQKSNQLAESLIGGVDRYEIDKLYNKKILSHLLNEDYPFYLNPLPNLYFMRDPATVIGNGISINAMNTPVRKRESMFIRMICKYHPLLSMDNIDIFYDDTQNHSIEGGDILILSDKVIAVGCSQRTATSAIEILAQNIFKQSMEIEEVLVIQIPKERAFMHLDTVFTMVDYDKFTIYPGIESKIQIVKISRGSNDNVKYEKMDNLNEALKKSLGLNQINLIQSGGGDPVVAAREQWNDSTNTLAIAPGVIIAYSRNEASNEVLRKNGIEVLEISASELVRGRGGPRCMSMPLHRE